MSSPAPSAANPGLPPRAAPRPSAGRWRRRRACLLVSEAFDTMGGPTSSPPRPPLTARRRSGKRAADPREGGGGRAPGGGAGQPVAKVASHPGAAGHRQPGPQLTPVERQVALLAAGGAFQQAESPQELYLRHPHRREPSAARLREARDQRPDPAAGGPSTSRCRPASDYPSSRMVMARSGHIWGPEPVPSSLAPGPRRSEPPVSAL